LIVFMPQKGEAMIRPGQIPSVSKECPTGTKEAEQLFQLGTDYFRGLHGMPKDKARAEKIFLEALELGSAKAALSLGQLYLYRYDYGTVERLEGEQQMVQMFQKAADMGCPEGLYGLTAAYSNGLGVPKDRKKALKLLKRAAEGGALNAMVEYGMIIFDEGKEQEGIAWLEKSLTLGNGDAATNLTLLYMLQGDSEGIIRSARAGSRLGSLTALVDLAGIYLLGRYGQEEDEEYARRLDDELIRNIDTREPAKPIPDFDERFPPKPVLPYKR
jgi:hypothetical protein